MNMPPLQIRFFWAYGVLGDAIQIYLVRVLVIECHLNSTWSKDNFSKIIGLNGTVLKVWWK